MRSLAIVMPVLAALAGCASSTPSASAPPPPEVTVAPVVQRSEATWIDLPGRITARQRVEIRPRIAGPIRRVGFADGDLVQAGDLLFEIDIGRERGRRRRGEVGLFCHGSERKLLADRVCGLWSVIGVPIMVVDRCVEMAR